MCEAFGVEVSQLKTPLGRRPDMNALSDLLKDRVDAFW